MTRRWSCLRGRAGGVFGVLAVSVVAAGRAAAQEAAPPGPDLLWAKLGSEVTRIERGFDGILGVAIKDLTDGRTFTLNADLVMPTASMIKIAVLGELYRQGKQAERYRVDAADALPGDDILSRLTPGVTELTWRDVAVMMVAVSDNSATNVLIDRLGMPAINRMLESIGLQATRLNRRMLDLAAAKAGRENVATPREMVALLEAIHRGRVVPADRLADFLGVLGMHKEGYLNDRLPEGTPIANKPGWLDGVRADAALGLPPGRPFAISVMTTFGANDRAAEAAIAEIGELTWRFFERLGQSSRYGRRM